MFRCSLPPYRWAVRDREAPWLRPVTLLQGGLDDVFPDTDGIRAEL